jgi:uncharacterized protein (UPF0332 family)
MTPSPAEKSDLARYRMEKAKMLLKDAEILLQSGSFSSSANRSYYAILAAARSLLALRGTDPETQEGVKVFLWKEYIKPRLLPMEAGEIFRMLQARRMDSDYCDYIEIGSDEATDSVRKARQFIFEADRVLQATLTASGS